MHKRLIIIATFNEATSLPRLLSSLLQVCPSHDVLVVDDSSPDGTADIAMDISKRYCNLHVMRRNGAYGLGSAILAGFSWALAGGYNWIVNMDADLSHDPLIVPVLSSFCEERGVDVLIGSRYVENGAAVGWPLQRRVLSLVGNYYLRYALRLTTLKDLTSGFRLYSKEVVSALLRETFSSAGHSFHPETIWRAARLGFNIAEYPITFVDRRSGASKLRLRGIIETLYLPLSLRHASP